MGEPNGSISIIEPLFPLFENKLKNLHVSFSEVSKFIILFSLAEFFAISSAEALTSFAITLSTPEISFETLNDLAPKPLSPSKSIFGFSKFSQNAE